jgi:hypothetical protein
LALLFLSFGFLLFFFSNSYALLNLMPLFSYSQITSALIYSFFFFFYFLSFEMVFVLLLVCSLSAF